jgi:hypothetical protein
MWYKIAKQGSLWSRISPTFEQDVYDAIKKSYVDGKVDLTLFQDNFSKIPNNPLSDYSFESLPTAELYGSDGIHFRDEKRIGLNNAKPIEVPILLHEIIHAIETQTIPFIKEEAYTHPGIPAAAFSGKWESNQEPLLRVKKREEEEKYYIEELSKDKNLTPEQIRTKAKQLTDSQMKQFESAAKSMPKDADYYDFSPSELRAQRGELNYHFSIPNLTRIYEGFYSKIENGREFFIKELYDLIQTISNVKDVNKVPNILQASELFKHLQFDRNLFTNINEQYIRQVAKMLSDSFIEMKKKLNVKSFDIDMRPLKLKNIIRTYMREITNALRKIDREALMLVLDEPTQENLQRISDIWDELNKRVENNTLVLNEKQEKIRKKINSVVG